LFKIKIIYILLAFSNLLAQDRIYNGEVTFNYNGTTDGYFSSIINDSISSSLAFNQDNGDSSSFLFASITQQGNNEFDLFLAVLTDTIFPMQPRSWEIPGDGDEENPLSFETVLVLMPGLDSSFVLSFLESFSDTSSSETSEDLITEIFTNFSDDLYLGLQGSLQVDISNDSTISGSFNSILIKPAFHIPPHLISVDDGQFLFNNATVSTLNMKDTSSPDQIKLLNTYPNPFNPVVNIQFSTAINSPISLKIYDLSRREVVTLFKGFINKGSHQFKWDATKYSSGIYITSIKTKNSIQSKKIIFTK
jgi:hypothetical protein